VPFLKILHEEENIYFNEKPLREKLEIFGGRE
jgi:hypothetical protein